MRFRSIATLSAQIAIFAFLSVSVAAAQTTEQCRALFVQALNSVASQCSDGEIGTACYGFDQVTASFNEAVPEDYFSQVGDFADLAITDSIDTSPANFQESTLGMSLLRVDGRPAGTATAVEVVILLIGGQEIEDGVSENSLLSPLQSFFLPVDLASRTGEAVPTNCMNEVPPMVFIQSPETQPVELVIYSIPVRLQGAIVVRIVPATDTSPDLLEFMVLTGDLILNPNAPNQIVIPEGSVISIPLGDELVSLGDEGDADELQLGTQFSPPRTMTPDEIDFFSFFVANLPVALLNFDFDFPAPTPVPTPVPPPGGGVGGPVGGGPIGGPVPVTPSCGTFALTSPTDGLAYGLNTVYWNPAVGVTGYTVTITNLDNNQQTSVSAGPGATNAQIDASVLGTGFSAQLSVAALGPNGVVCQDVRTMLRAVPPTPPPGAGDPDPEPTPCPPGQQPSGVGGACIPAP